MAWGGIKQGCGVAGHTTEPMNRLFTLPKTVLATKGTIQQNQYGKYTRNKGQWLL